MTAATWWDHQNPSWYHFRLPASIRHLNRIPTAFISSQHPASLYPTKQSIHNILFSVYSTSSFCKCPSNLSQSSRTCSRNCPTCTFLILSILVPDVNLNIFNSATCNSLVQDYVELNSMENRVSDSAPLCSYRLLSWRNICIAVNQQLGLWGISWQCWAMTNLLKNCKHLFCNTEWLRLLLC